jgi:hypothetical protein
MTAQPGDPGAGGSYTVVPSGDSTGATDTTAITAALGAAVAGGVVTLAPGEYFTSGPLTIGSGVALAGTHGAQGRANEVGTTIMAATGFGGAAMITFDDGSSEQTVTDLNLDASALPDGTTTGISAHGLVVTGLSLARLLITGTGFNQGVIGGGKGWWADRVTVANTSGTGFSLGSLSDCTWLRCHAIANGNQGWYLSNLPNSRLIGCKGEFSANFGFHISGFWTTGDGAGGMTLTGCGTDRNTRDGMLIDATGTAPILISGHMARRDGSSGTESAGVTVNNASTPVIISGLTVYPGFNDDGSGTLSPQAGLSVRGTPAWVSVADAFLHAAVTPLDGTPQSARNVAGRTGPPAAPSDITALPDSA